MLSIVADLKQFYERFSAYTYPNLYKFFLRHHDRIEIDTSISVIMVSPTTWEAHHNDPNLGINSYNLHPIDQR